MINIRIDKKDGRSLCAFGHAGFAPAGQDIVCAAVSTLVQALALMQTDGCVVEMDADTRTYIHTPEALMDERMCGAWAMAEAALAQIARQYPAHVHVRTP